jgi:outer membrane protein assembly factor BamB
MFSLDNAGKLIWKTSIVGFPLSAQFTPSGRLIFVTHIGMIYVMERATGKNILTYELNPGKSSDLSAFDPLACMRGTKDCPEAFIARHG